MFKKYLYRNFRLLSAFTFWLRWRFTKAGLMVGGGMVLMAARMDTSLSVGFQAFCLLLCLLSFSMVASRFTRSRFTARRLLPRLGTAGQPVHYRVVLRNAGRRAIRGAMLHELLPDPRPDFTEFISNPEPGEEKRNWLDRTYLYYRWRWLIGRNTRARMRSQPVPWLPPQGELEVPVEITPLRRGRLCLDQIRLAIPDPFGLANAFSKFSLPEVLLVLPRRYPVPPIALPGHLKYQAGGVAMASSVGESEEFVSLRDYQPGDPLRHIHWKSWAKTGRPIVKEYEDEFFVRHALILDTFAGVDHSEVFEEAVSIAASFACTLQTQDSLLDLLFVGPEAYCFTMGRGLAHLEQMLEILAAVKTCRERPFAALHQLVLGHSVAVSGCVCVFIQWDDPRRKLVEHLRMLQIPLLVIVVTGDGLADGLDPGPLADCPQMFHPMARSQVAEKLAAL